MQVDDATGPAGTRTATQSSGAGPETTTDPALVAAINPRVRKSPFFDATVEDGLAAVSGYNHMWLPTSYGDPEAEYRRLTKGVAMWDVAAQRHIEVSGPDADDLVALATTVDTEGCGNRDPACTRPWSMWREP